MVAELAIPVPDLGGDTGIGEDDASQPGGPAQRLEVVPQPGETVRVQAVEGKPECFDVFVVRDGAPDALLGRLGPGPASSQGSNKIAVTARCKAHKSCSRLRSRGHSDLVT